MDEITSHPPHGARKEDKDLIVITGSSGRIGHALVKRLVDKYRVVGLDRVGPPYPPVDGVYCGNSRFLARNSPVKLTDTLTIL